MYGFFDASHADDVDTRRSTIAYVFFFSGCAISWKSKLHTFVTTSTNHSELVAAAMAGREAKFLWKLFGAMDLHGHASLFCKRVDLFSDSMGVVAISTNPVLSASTKHIEIADFFVRELVSNRIVTVSFVRTAYMVADVLTKALGPDKFFRFMGVILGLVRDVQPAAVQMTRAFRSSDPRPWDDKPIRDSTSLGRRAEKDGQPSVAEKRPVRDSPSFGRS